LGKLFHFCFIIFFETKYPSCPVYYYKEAMVIQDRTKEKELIARIQNGDIIAFAQLVNQYSTPVLTFIHRIVSSKEDAEDISQEVFIKVYKGINQFRSDSSFSTWLYAIVKNTCYSYLQKKRPNMISLDKKTDVVNTISINYPENTPERIAERNDFRDNVMDCLTKLSPKYNMVIQLFYYQQLRYEEIAKVLQIPLGTVKTHLHRALRALRREVLKNLYNDSKRGE